MHIVFYKIKNKEQNLFIIYKIFFVNPISFLLYKKESIFLK